MDQCADCRRGGECMWAGPTHKKWRMGREPLSAIISYRLEFYGLAFPRVSG